MKFKKRTGSFGEIRTEKKNVLFVLRRSVLFAYRQTHGGQRKGNVFFFFLFFDEVRES